MVCRTISSGQAIAEGMIGSRSLGRVASRSPACLARASKQLLLMALHRTLECANTSLPPDYLPVASSAGMKF